VDTLFNYIGLASYVPANIIKQYDIK